MIRTSLRFAAAIATVAVVASPAAAQSWTAIGTPNNSNTGAYWNNTSDDNVGSAVCNVGSLLTNAALSPASCTNETPTSLLPITPTPLPASGVYLSNVAGSRNGFGFAAGTYRFNLLGRVAGIQSTQWGIISDDLTSFVFTGAELAGTDRLISRNFILWVNAAIPASETNRRFTSTKEISTLSGGIPYDPTSNQQFAVFSSTASGLSDFTFGSFTLGKLINPIGFQTFFVGMEDNVNGGRGFGAGAEGVRVSDRDYNDILISVQAVPEPSTYALMATGLALMGAVARRRRTA